MELYDFNMDLMPSNGLLVVDTSGITPVKIEKSLVGSLIYKSQIGVEAERMIYNKLRNRGRVLTTKGCLEEIDNSIISLRRMIKSTKRDRGNYCYKRGKKIHNSITEHKSIEVRNTMGEIIRIQERFYGLLREGMEEYKDFPIQVNPDETLQFAKRDSRLSECNSGLVSRALCLGSWNGILSSDLALINNYKEGVKRFGLVNCFAYNGVTGKVERVSSSERSISQPIK